MNRGRRPLTVWQLLDEYSSMYKIIGADGKEYGPVNADQLRRWIAEGRVNAQTRVQPAGTTEYRPLSDFPELLPPPRPDDLPSLQVSGPTPSSPAASRVAGPAIALIVVGVLNAISGVVGLILSLTGSSLLAIDQLPPELAPMISGTVVVVSNLIGLIISMLIMYGGVQMKNLRSYGLAMTASILVALPCTSPCCILGLPIAIWALVVLSKPDVKSAFGA